MAPQSTHNNIKGTHTNNNNNNNNIKGFQPAIWGPLLWPFLHMAALNFDTAADAKNMADFLQALAAVLPCAKCKQHYQQYLSHNPPPVKQGSTAVLQWILDLERAVAATSTTSTTSPPPALAAGQVAAYYHPMRNGYAPKRAQVQIATASQDCYY